MSKSPQMVAFLDQVSLETYGRKRSECIKNKQCVACGKQVDGDYCFPSEVTHKEYYISGMCAECQQEAFKDE